MNKRRSVGGLDLGDNAEALANVMLEIQADFTRVEEQIRGAQKKIEDDFNSIGAKAGRAFDTALNVAVKASIAAGAPARLGRALASSIASSASSAMKNAFIGIFQGVGQGIYGSMKSVLMAPMGQIGTWIESAMASKATNRKFEAVFAGMVPDAQDWAKRFSSFLGRSSQETKGMMSKFQDTLVPMGFERGQASDITKTMTRLTADLAAYEKLSQGEVADRLVSGMVGNHESLRRFGVIITENTLKMKLQEMGIKGGTQAATEQEKAIARLNIVLDGTKDAHGMAAKSSSDLTSTLSGLNGIWEDISIAMGNIFMPAANEVANFIKSISVEIQGSLSNSESWGASLGEVAKNVISLFAPATEVIGTFARSFAESMDQMSQGDFGGVVETLKQIGAAVKDIFMEIVSGVTGVILGLFNQTKNTISFIIKSMGQAVLTFIKSIEDAIKNLADWKDFLTGKTTMMSENQKNIRNALANKIAPSASNQLTKALQGIGSGDTTSKDIADGIRESWNAGVQGYKGAGGGKGLEALANMFGPMVGPPKPGKGSGEFSEAYKPIKKQDSLMQYLSKVTGIDQVLGASVNVQAMQDTIKRAQEAQGKGIQFTSTESLYSKVQSSLGKDKTQEELLKKSNDWLSDIAKHAGKQGVTLGAIASKLTGIGYTE